MIPLSMSDSIGVLIVFESIMLTMMFIMIIHQEKHPKDKKKEKKKPVTRMEKKIEYMHCDECGSQIPAGSYKCPCCGGDPYRWQTDEFFESMGMLGYGFGHKDDDDEDRHKPSVWD